MKGLQTSIVVILTIVTLGIAIYLSLGAFDTVASGTEKGTKDILSTVSGWDFSISSSEGGGENECGEHKAVRLFEKPALDCSGKVANIDSDTAVLPQEIHASLGSFRVATGHTAELWTDIGDSDSFTNQLATVIGAAATTDWTGVKEKVVFPRGSKWTGGQCAATLHGKKNYQRQPGDRYLNISATTTAIGDQASMNDAAKSVKVKGGNTCYARLHQLTSFSGDQITVRQARRTLKLNNKIDEIDIRRAGSGRGGVTECRVTAWIEPRKKGGSELTCQKVRDQNGNLDCRCWDKSGSKQNGYKACSDIASLVPSTALTWTERISSLRARDYRHNNQLGCYAIVKDTDPSNTVTAELTGYTSILDFSGKASSVGVGGGPSCTARLYSETSQGGREITVAGKSSTLSLPAAKSVKPIGGDACPVRLKAGARNITLVHDATQLDLSKTGAVKVN